MAEQTDLAELIRRIQTEATTIVRGEIALAKQELVAQAKKTGIVAGMFGGAGYFALSGVTIIFGAAGFAWSAGYQAWFGLDQLSALAWGFLTTAVLLFLIAGILVLIGSKVPAPTGPTDAIEHATGQVELLKQSAEKAAAQAAALPLLGSTPESDRPELD